MHSLAAVQAMLLGLAIECLLKGMWIKKKQPWIDENREHELTKNGTWVGIPDAGDHDLKQLADVAQVIVSNEETAVLQRLSAFITFAGRYPISKKWQQMKPTKTENCGVVAPKYFSVVEMELAERLAARLMAEVLPWSKAASGAPGGVA